MSIAKLNKRFGINGSPNPNWNWIDREFNYLEFDAVLAAADNKDEIRPYIDDEGIRSIEIPHTLPLRNEKDPSDLRVKTIGFEGVFKTQWYRTQERLQVGSHLDLCHVLADWLNERGFSGRGGKKYTGKALSGEVVCGLKNGTLLSYKEKSLRDPQSRVLMMLPFFNITIKDSNPFANFEGQTEKKLGELWEVDGEVHYRKEVK